MKKTFLSILAIAAIAFTSCTISNEEPTTGFQADAANFKGNITQGTVTLNASLEYNLTQNWFNIVEAINRYDEMTRTTTSAAAATKSKLQHIEMRIANIDDTKLKKLNLKKSN